MLNLLEEHILIGPVHGASAKVRPMVVITVDAIEIIRIDHRRFGTAVEEHRGILLPQMRLNVPLQCELCGELFRAVVEDTSEGFLVRVLVNVLLQVVDTARRDFVHAAADPEAHLLLFATLLRVDVLEKMLEQRTVDVARVRAAIPAAFLLLGLLRWHDDGRRNGLLLKELFVRRLKWTGIGVHFHRFLLHLDNGRLTTARSFRVAAVTIASGRRRGHLETNDLL